MSVSAPNPQAGDPPQIEFQPLKQHDQFPQGTTSPPAQLEPGQMSSCPPGLEHLAQVDQLFVKGSTSKNNYNINNKFGHTVYDAKEDSDDCCVLCFGSLRSFDMAITDNSQNEVIHLNRIFPWCLQSIEVTSPPGTVIGTVEQEWSFLTTKLSIKNASGDTVLSIKSLLCEACKCDDFEFQIMSPDGHTQVGKITKEGGVCDRICSTSYKFAISFPMDLDVKTKAVILGALVLINVMIFERKQGCLT